MTNPSPLIAVDDVIERLLAAARPITEIQEVSIAVCSGRVLAEDIVSRVNVPPAPNSSMDGYAVDVDDDAVVEGAVLEISGRIVAGHVGEPLAKGTAARIFTGAPIPKGATAVVIQEDTELAGEGRVKLMKRPLRWENIRDTGQDIREGDLVLSAGTRIRPAEAALMASIGVAAVKVQRPLRIGVMSTGDELVEPPGPLTPGKIFNSNHYALMGLVRALGMDVVDLGLVPDDRDATIEALNRGAREADCILSSGGVSVGEEDHVKAALEELGRLDIWRIAIKPGKPLAFGEVAGTPFFGLPGNPVSTFVTFMMIAKPYLLKYQGCRDVSPRYVYARSAFEMTPGTRREYVRVRLGEGEDGELEVSAFGNQGSGVMSSVVWANALAEVDIGQAVRYGDRLKVFLIND